MMSLAISKIVNPIISGRFMHMRGRAVFVIVIDNGAALKSRFARCSDQLLRIRDESHVDSFSQIFASFAEETVWQQLV